MKKELLKFWFENCLLLVKLWYSFTMLLTRKSGVKVKSNFISYMEIAKELSFGMRYKKDPLNGMLDVLTHPTRIQDRINKDQLIDDCDGHAIYWATTLLKTHLVKNAWFSFIMFGDDSTDAIQGHAVCVFQDWNDQMFWVDYNKPKNFDNTSASTWDWCGQVCKSFSKDDGDLLKPLTAGMIKINKITETDTPVFGEITKKIF